MYVCWDCPLVYGVVLDPVQLQFSYIIYYLVRSHMYVLLLLLLSSVCSFCGHSGGQCQVPMRLSAVVVSIGSCEVRVILHHLLFSDFTCIVYCW